MKAKLFLTTCLCLAITSVNAQTPPNAGFEIWQNFGPFEEPQGWITDNLFYGAPYAITKTTDFNNGSYAIQVQTQFNTSAGGNVGSALAIFPFAQRPVSLTGFYKLAPVGGDTVSIRCFLYRWNGSSQDIIGFAEFITSGAASSYASFTAPFNYFLSPAPDTAMLVITTVLSNSTSNVNTVFKVDDLGFVLTGVGENNNPASDISIYPNPSGGKFIVSAGRGSIDKIEIYNSVGEIIYSATLPFNNSTVNLTAQPAGIYFVRVRMEEGVKTKKVVIQR